MIGKHLGRFDRWLWRVWLACSAAALIAVWGQVLVVLLFITIVGAPLAMLIQQAPGAWVYLTLALLIYVPFRLVLRRTSPALLLAAAAVPPIAAGFIVPVLANRETRARVAAMVGDDGGQVPTISRGSSITYVNDLPSEDPRCSDICQRLLFSQTASSYTEGSLGADWAVAPPLHRYYLGPLDGRCNNARLTASYASREEAGDVLPPPRLWDRLPAFIDEGLCFHADPAVNARSDWLMVQSYFQHRRRGGAGAKGAPDIDFSLHPLRPEQRREVYRREGDTLVRVMRRTEVRYALLAVPLWFEQPIAFSGPSPARWRTGGDAIAGSRIDVYRPTRWNGFIANDIRVDGLLAP
ncbi:hypothetical protein GGR88_001102 [Sphingomonas jejuensis]|uniref:Uncharacterized protein n=1 Tax=Sphingomonas jejuensis TaxID=904715 RepID=A0ABX0XJV8_9SPHN|nr:hypothetical protein [Sphingomonas jejuensis]NJC33628.1 hypothetical protein [Sphingomonas jejuensis]